MSDVQTIMIIGGQEILAEVVKEDDKTLTVENALVLIPIQIPTEDEKGEPVIYKRTGKPEIRTTLTFMKFGLGHDSKKTLVLNKSALVFNTSNVPAALIRMWQAALGKVVTSGQQGLVVP